MMYPLLQLFLARVREYYRMPETLFWVYGFPLIVAIGLGIAFWDRRPEPARVDVVASADGTAENLRLHLAVPELHVEIHGLDQCWQRFRAGKTALFVEAAPEGFRYVFDQSRPESVSARCEVDATIARWKSGVKVENLENPGPGESRRYLPPGQEAQPWQTMDAPVTEPGNRYIDFLMPGLMGVNIMGGGLYGVGFVIVDMRMRKLLKRLLATPMRRNHFLLSLLGARLALLLPEMALLLLAACLGFNVPLRGNALTLILVIVCGAGAFASLGLLLATRTDKTETISGLISLIMIPGYLFSGTFFSWSRFPQAVQPLIKYLPLTQLNDALREVILEGGSLSQVGWRLAILVAWGLAAFLLALKWFRWQ